MITFQKTPNYLSLRKKIDSDRPEAGLFYTGELSSGVFVKDRLTTEQVNMGKMLETADAFRVNRSGLKPSLLLKFAEDNFLSIPVGEEIAKRLEAIEAGELSAVEYAPEKWSFEEQLARFLLLGKYIKECTLLICIKQESVYKSKSKSKSDSPNFTCFAAWLPPTCTEYKQAFVTYADLWDKDSKKIKSFAQICGAFPVVSDFDAHM